ncbi:uncharacterized protein LOC107487410 isoform X1 [Arachis duranensis]|uniref:Uncharacterized protein LOC107487410 isoform X1 n=1 Tax=Arachis duranensis TaxID=130453 RepID=A0A6P4D7C8_ARADU|nr:uncharacterized protein LOC107487410 isoform X1 [Arachis duranensis]
MAVPLRMSNNNKRAVLARLKSLINTQQLQRFCTSMQPKGKLDDRLSPKGDLDYSALKERNDFLKWKTLDASKLGITTSKLSNLSQIVLKHLDLVGFKSYLVGGCVRDLLLNRTPKDFDVITTAELHEVKKHCRKIGHAIIVGRRFPVCLVNVKGSQIEITSFATEAQTFEGSDQVRRTLLPKSKCNNEEDLIRCKNSLYRDFTINSLFYDPSANKIYDYANGIADLRSLKLETVIPAQLSFKEDPGRILRGFRMAARLGLSLSREIEAAILAYSSQVKNMNKTKLLTEVNYMLSYGAAEPSLRLLWKFKLLEFLFPVHAAYLDEQVDKEGVLASNMLMKLFLHLDNLVACDRPSDCTLWIGLLAFHLALINNPQEALVVWALASILYHGNWKDGVKFAKEHAEVTVNFAPEIRMSCLNKSEEEIAKAVTELASHVIHSVCVLVNNDSLRQSMARYPSSPCSGTVFVPGKKGQIVGDIFRVLVNDVQLYRSERKGSKIKYGMLSRGSIEETRYVFGKIVLNTMISCIVGNKDDFEAEKCHLKTQDTEESGQSQISNSVIHKSVARKHERQALSPSPESKQGKIKKQKLVDNDRVPEQKVDMASHELVFKETSQEWQKQAKLTQKVDPSMMKGFVPKMKKHPIKHPARPMKTVKQNSHTPSQFKVSKNHHEVADSCNINVDAKATNKSHLKKKRSQSSSDEKVLKHSLSSLFRK